MRPKQSADDGSGAVVRVLLVHPQFTGGSFWNYTDTCALIGARYPAPPLGLITVAAMLPQSWDLRLIDLNANDDARALAEAIEWSDLVMLGGMLPQRFRALGLIDQVRAAGKPVAVGGPDVSSSREYFSNANFRLIGEAEGCIDAFVRAWEAGERQGDFEAPLHSVDVTKTPIPRFDLLRFSDYTQVALQFSRDCPFLCEYCDIIELFGRKPRTKTTEQMLAELDRIYALGFRGHVDLVDDNLIGNKKAVKAFLPELIEWQRRHGYPFEFSTEASLNLADDPELLKMMSDANFFAVFVGIESPDPDVLVMAQKKQNTRRDIAQSIHRINAAGLFVVGGFIVGFDNEKPGTADGLIDLIEEASIPVSMVGLLYALPGTQLTRRLEREGRLFDYDEGHILETATSDQCTQGLNFETLRPRVEVLADFRKVVAHIYACENYFARIRRTVDLLDCSGENGELRRSTLLQDAVRFLRLMWNATLRQPELRGPLWRLVAYILRRNPRALKGGLDMAALYAHLGPFSRFVVSEIDRQIEEVAAAGAPAPVASNPVAPGAAAPPPLPTPLPTPLPAVAGE